MFLRPSGHAVEVIVRAALLEDAPWGDITSQTYIPVEANFRAQLISREAGILCGEDIFTAAMMLTGPTLSVHFYIHDGESFDAGEVLAEVSGSARAILQAERVALNFVQRLSGIAKLTAIYVAAVAGRGAHIVDTRKTTPGLRLFERYAVRCGGGQNHRYSLSDAVMLKDNHLAALDGNDATNLTEQLLAARARLPHTTHVEVEVDRLDQIEAVLAARVDTIMLDNFTLADLRTGVNQIARRAIVEASGGVTLESVGSIAATGVDIISVGALTHSFHSLDIGLDISK